MKKTVTINISGIIFHIDEDAFEKLSNYISIIKGHFTNSEGCDEIISDIESRIAEMLNAKINEQKQVITIEDINEVISIMGEPEQIGEEGGGKKAKENKASQQQTNRKRFYRDPDNKVLGGVCSGISAYFNIDPIWIRIAFIILTLSLFGLGTLLYIILWIIIPEAKTTAEKLEMRGEPVNISNIESSIRDEMDELKNRFKNLKNDAKSAYSNNFKKYHPQTVAEKIINFFIILLKYFVRVLAIFIGIIFIIAGIFLVTGFIFSFFRAGDLIWVSSSGISNFSLPVFLNFFINSPQYITLALLGLALLIGIPLIMLVYNGIKLVFGIKSRKRIISISTFSLWFAGLILCLFVAVHISRNFIHKSVVTKKYSIVQPQNNILKIYVKKDNLIDSVSEFESKKFGIGRWNTISLNHKNISFGLPILSVVKSENDKYQLIAYYSSRGKNREDAEKHIKKVGFTFKQEDTCITLPPYFLLPEKENWRGQRLKIVVKVPLWKAIYFSDETSSLFNSHIYYSDDIEEGEYDYLSGKTWIMTDNGLREYYGMPNTNNAINDTIKKSITDTVKNIIPKK